MPRTRPPYPPEFRRQAVELIRSGTPLKQVASELGVSEQTLRTWRRQQDVDAVVPRACRARSARSCGGFGARTAGLQQERDILKAAAAFFARETGRR